MRPTFAWFGRFGFIASVFLSSQSFAAMPISEYIGMALSGVEAEGELGGKMAADISKTTNASTPVFVHAKLLSKLAVRTDCGRVAMVIRQRVPTTDGRQADWAQEMELNICENGQPPETGADLRRLAPTVKLLSE